MENISRGPTFRDFVTIRTEGGLYRTLRLKTTEYKSTDSPLPPSFKCNILRESLSVDSQNIPCVRLKRRGPWVISVYFWDPHTPAAQLFVSCYLIAVEPLDVLWLAGREAGHAGEVDGAAQVNEHVRPPQDLSHRICTVLRSSLVVRASDCQCTSCNGPGFDPSIRRHSGI
jgi:hypothetical protein